MQDPTPTPPDDERPEPPETPPPAPETENIEEEGDPLGANFA